MRGCKIFNDPIHGHIEISPLAVKVIDTPQFQRLRDISQLGGTYYVFPGAASHRFEHCLGVCYLASVFIHRLRENQPELNITDVDALCVEIAGLCHDLGHGPFSHLYDGKFLPLILGNHDFKHEHASIAIFDLLLHENNLLPIFAEYGLFAGDVQFIKELILGDVEDAPPGFTWHGRNDKHFLYDIVANKRNGIDVDKFDYFARDCHVLGLTKSFDALRLMKFARVFTVERSRNSQTTQQSEVCFHVKEAWNILELFHTRYTLHKRAYQHRVCNTIELMLTEVLLLSDPYITIYGENNTPRKMSEAPQDMHAYWKMSEYLLKQIEYSLHIPMLKPAQDIISRLRKRDLFAFVGETILTSVIITALLRKSRVSVSSSAAQMIKSQLWQMLQQQQQSTTTQGVEESDVFCTVVKLGYGRGNRNPIIDTTAFFCPDKDANNADDDEVVEGNGKRRGERELRWKLGSLPAGTVLYCCLFYCVFYYFMHIH